MAQIVGRYDKGGVDEDIISGGTDMDDTIYSSVGAGKSNQLYSQLGAYETKTNSC